MFHPDFDDYEAVDAIYTEMEGKSNEELIHMWRSKTASFWHTGNLDYAAWLNIQLTHLGDHMERLGIPYPE